MEKQVSPESSEGTPDGRVFSGTLVVKGRGRAEVTAIGSNTQMGGIGVSLVTIDTGKTTLQIETARVVRFIATLAVALCVVLAASLYATPVATIFRFEALAAQDLLLAFAAGVAGVIGVEAAKYGRSVWCAVF